MTTVVDHLVFDAEPFLAADFSDPVFDAVVAFGIEFPLPFEFKIGVFVFRDQTAATFASEVNRVVAFGGPAAGRGFAIQVGEISKCELNWLGGGKE